MKQEDALRINQVEVKGLFGLYNHKIKLNLKDRVTIIHGPNGVGKTALLKLIAVLFSGKLAEFARVQFSEFVITLSDGTCLNFKRDEKEIANDNVLDVASPQRGININALATFIDGRSKEEGTLDLPSDEKSISMLARLIGEEVPELARVAPDQWRDRRYNEYLTADQIIDRYSDRLPRLSRFSRLYTGKKIFDEFGFFRNIRRRVRIHFIETQRLLKFIPQDSDWLRRNGDPIMVSAVKSDAVDLKKKIDLTLADYGKESQTLDQSFPQRLLRESHRSDSAYRLKQRMEDLEKRREKLKDIGLLDNDGSSPFDVSAIDSLSQDRLEVLALYLSDSHSKLNVLDDFAKRVRLFRDTVNKKFRRKRILVNRQDGMRAISDGTNANLDLDSLSSGEQHELVLIYDLLFKVKPDTLVLLDEPELSFHLNWQKEFMSDFLKIAEVAQFYAIVATHSPYIAGHRPDLMVALEDGDGVNYE